MRKQLRRFSRFKPTRKEKANEITGKSKGYSVIILTPEVGMMARASLKFLITITLGMVTVMTFMQHLLESNDSSQGSSGSACAHTDGKAFRNNLGSIIFPRNSAAR